MTRSLTTLTVAILAACTCIAGAAVAQIDPLASWNDGPAKQSILTLVQSATDSSSPSYVAPENRIATFDNDGTLWVSHPLYAQAMFLIDRVRELAARHPQWRKKKPFSTMIAGDLEALATLREADWETLTAAAHKGITTDEFAELATQWLATAEHPRYHRRYTELAYQPMLELLAYLRANGFKTFIVTGGGQDFVRAFSSTVYGIPPEQVIGSSMRVEYEVSDEGPALVRQRRPFLHDDKEGKPVGIHLLIGKRPWLAVGNSHGDEQMLEWTTALGGTRMGMLVLHDDDAREYAYGPAAALPDTKVGTFPQELLDRANAEGWVVISMKHDWKRLFAFED